MPRSKTSPYRYDRVAIKFVLETEGLGAARERWPRDIVDVIARPMGLTKPYNNRPCPLTPQQVACLGSKPDSVLAGEWNLAHTTVSATRRKLGIRRVDPGFSRRQRVALVAALTIEDLLQPVVETAGRLNVPSSFISAERRRRGLKARRQGWRAMRSIVAHLRGVALGAMRLAYPEVTLEELGEALGITRERVRQIEELERFTVDRHVASLRAEAVR